jgi:hypothetical protein
MFPVVPPLIAAEAATRIRTPLAEFAIGARILLVLAPS